MCDPKYSSGWLMLLEAKQTNSDCDAVVSLRRLVISLHKYTTFSTITEKNLTLEKSLMATRPTSHN